MRNQIEKQKCKIASYDLLNIKRKGENVKMLKEKGINLGGSSIKYGIRR